LPDKPGCGRLAFSMSDDARDPVRLHAGQTEVFLQPGEYFVGDASHRISTFLGSCVSVTLWDAEKRIGAMSHFLLAARCDVPEHASCMDARYGDEALQLMLRDLARRDVRPAQCQAKVFGGGDMFPALTTSARLNIGRRNGEAARALLQAQGIELISESLFGPGHRHIVFDVGLGHVWSRQVKPSSDRVKPTNGLSP
jgi:chemotaxis protein CheD